MAAGIWRHEGFGTGSKLNGHEAQARDALVERHIPKALESMVHDSEDAHRRDVTQFVGDARGYIHYRGSKASEALGNWSGTAWQYRRAEGRFLIKEFNF